MGFGSSLRRAAGVAYGKPARAYGSLWDVDRMKNLAGLLAAGAILLADYTGFLDKFKIQTII